MKLKHKCLCCLRDCYPQKWGGDDQSWRKDRLSLLSQQDGTQAWGRGKDHHWTLKPKNTWVRERPVDPLALKKVKPCSKRKQKRSRNWTNLPSVAGAEMQGYSCCQCWEQLWFTGSPRHLCLQGQGDGMAGTGRAPGSHLPLHCNPGQEQVPVMAQRMILGSDTCLIVCLNSHLTLKILWKGLEIGVLWLSLWSFRCRLRSGCFTWNLVFWPVKVFIYQD